MFYATSITLPKFDSVAIHSDCQAAIESIINNTGIHTKLITNIIDSTIILNSKDISVELCWIPGHAGITANDLANIEAKKVAETAKNWSDNQDDSDITIKDAQRVLHNDLLKTWQRQWDMQPEGRYTHALLPSVKLKPLHRSHGKVLPVTDVRFNRL